MRAPASKAPSGEGEARPPVPPGAAAAELGKLLLEPLLGNNVGRVRHLLECRADANARFGPFECFRSFDSGSPLVVAVLKRKDQMIDLLLQYKGDLNKSTYSFMAGPVDRKVEWSGSAIFAAMPAGDVDFVGSLVDRKADPHFLSQNGAAPIWNASYFGHGRVLEYLLSKRADVENSAESQEDVRLRYSPLHVAARNGRLECVQLLLEAHAKLDGNCPIQLADTEGTLRPFYITPLDDAIESGHMDVVTLLLSSKAQVIITDEARRETVVPNFARPGTPPVTRERYALEAAFAGQNSRVVSTMAAGLQDFPEQVELLQVQDLVRFLRTPGDAPVQILTALFAQKEIKYWLQPQHQRRAQERARTGRGEEEHVRARQSEMMNSTTSKRTWVTAAIMERITVYGKKRFMINVAEGPSASTIDDKHRLRQDAPPDLLAFIDRIAPQPHRGRRGLLEGLRDGQYVQISCHMCLLPDIHHRPEVLMAIASTSNPDVFDMPECEAIIYQSWESVWKLHVLETAGHGVTNFLCLGVALCLRNEDLNVRGRRILMLASLALPLVMASAVMRVAQTIGSWRLGRASADRAHFYIHFLLHMLRIGATLGVLLYMVAKQAENDALDAVGFRVCLLLVLMHRWVFFFTLVRLINADLNVIIDPIVGSIWRCLPFCMAIMSFVFVAFQSYWCLNVDGMESPFEAFLIVFKMFMHSISPDELEGLVSPLQLDAATGIWSPAAPPTWERPNYFYIRAFILIGGVAFPVMMMSMLIGVLSKWLDYSIENVWKTFQQQRVILVLDYMALKKVCNCRHRNGLPDESKPPRHVWFANLKDESGEQQSVSPVVAPALVRMSALERHILRKEARIAEALKVARSVRHHLDHHGADTTSKMDQLTSAMQVVSHNSSLSVTPLVTGFVSTWADSSDSD